MDMPAEKCRYCDLHHDGACPRVKAIDYYPDGSVKRVEFGTLAMDNMSFKSPRYDDIVAEVERRIFRSYSPRFLPDSGTFTYRKATPTAMVNPAEFYGRPYG